MSYDFVFTEPGYESNPPYNFWFYLFIHYDLLPDNVNNLISIDIDENTYFSAGNLYITMKNHFVVVNLATMAVTDMYTKDIAGKSLETLDYEDIEKSDIS